MTNDNQEDFGTLSSQRETDSRRREILLTREKQKKTRARGVQNPPKRKSRERDSKSRVGAGRELLSMTSERDLHERST